MTTPPTSQQLDDIETRAVAAVPARSVRPVIEHALTAYGYSPDTARTLIDQLTAEARAE